MNQEKFEDRVKWKALMKSLEFFEPFADADLDELLDCSDVKKYNMQDYIIKEAKEGYAFYVIMRGSAHIIKRDALNVKREIAQLSTGDCFGEMAVLLEEPRTASVKAGNDCYVFEINGDQISKLKMETQMKLFRGFAITLAKRLKLSSAR